MRALPLPADLGGTRANPRLGLRYTLTGELAGVTLDAIMATARWRIAGAEHHRALVDARQRFILAFWHGRLLPLGYLHRGCGHGLMISRSKDGEYGSALARHWGQIPVRGSTSRGGALALAEMVDHLGAGHSVAFTPDGPRGPRERMKPGPIAAAQKTGAPILPFSCGASRAWYLHSWDRMLVPKPFARIAVCYGPPFYVRPADDPEQKRCALEDELRRLTALAEAEAGSTGPDGVVGAPDMGPGDPAPVGAEHRMPGSESP
jgi:hypothetical protein